VLAEIVPGLARWTAAHPDWNPHAIPGSADDWGQMVGCVLYDGGDVVALIDPLIPSALRAPFLEELDARIANRPVSILTTIHYHRRDREQLAERYRANNSGRAWNAVPAGVQPHPLRRAGETLFWLPAVAALIAGDRLIVSGNRLRVCPQSWLASSQVDRPGLADLLRPLIELPIERVIVSHGDPVLHDGRAAIARAVEEAWAK
jgi:hypothetical protein